MITEWNDDLLIQRVAAVAEEAAREGAGFVAATAKARVKKLTGNLARQISVGVSKFKGGGYIVAAQGKPGQGKYYASFVELGTAKDQKQPFLRPALAANKRKIMRNFQDKLK